jgi:hypothetical protein
MACSDVFPGQVAGHGNNPMNFQYESSPQAVPLTTTDSTQVQPPSETVELLRQMLDVQRQQLQYLQASLAAHDMASRWRAFLTRWHEQFPHLGDDCKIAVPILERTYGKLISELADHLRDNGDDALENEFALQEFLDRYGMRIAQLGTILNLVAPLAEAGSQEDQSQDEAAG